MILPRISRSGAFRALLVFTSWTALVSALLAAVAQPRPKLEDLPTTFKECEPANTSSPPPELGRHGDNDYQFSYISDVDRVDGVYRFHRVLRNEHGKNYLPAEWERAGIRFDWIEPKRCGWNMFETACDHTIDDKAPVRYGPAKQYTQGPNRLHVVKADCQERIQAGEAAALLSHVFAELVPERGKVVLDVRLKTSVEGGVFRYEIQNHGTSPFELRIPALTQRWQPLGGKTEVSWPAGREDRFMLSREKPRQPFLHIVRPRDGVGQVTPSVVPIELFLPDKSEPIARARVTLYFPSPVRP